MKITDNYSITTLFITKNINIYCDNKIIKLNVPTIKDLYTNLDLNSIYHIWTSSFEDLQKLYFTPITDCFNAIETMIFEYGQYNRYRIIATKMREVLVWLIPNINIDMKSKILSVDGLTITSEIWDYILYILNQPATIHLCYQFQVNPFHLSHKLLIQILLDIYLMQYHPNIYLYFVYL